MLGGNSGGKPPVKCSAATTVNLAVCKWNRVQTFAFQMRLSF